MKNSIDLFEGYFWYDLCDILSNRSGSDLWEMLLHHILVSLICLLKEILSLMKIFSRRSSSLVLISFV